MRTIKLSPELTYDIRAMCNHNINSTDRSLSQDYEELRDLTLHDKRFRLIITLEEKIPLCSDIIVNILVKHILDIVDCNEDDTEEMNAFYEYLTNTHGWTGDDSGYLLKATTVEALEYGVRWLINSFER